MLGTRQYPKTSRAGWQGLELGRVGVRIKRNCGQLSLCMRGRWFPRLDDRRSKHLMYKQHVVCSIVMLLTSILREIKKKTVPSHRYSFFLYDKILDVVVGRGRTGLRTSTSQGATD